MKGYKAQITDAMTDIAKRDKDIVFVGYNVRYGRFGGTLSGVQEEQLIETPTAENLMTGIGIGLSITGRKPVICFERFDFVLNALDAIVNHLDKIDAISNGEFKPFAVLRIVVGNKEKPLFTGIPHTQDFFDALEKLVSFPVLKVTQTNVDWAWSIAFSDLQVGKSVALVEYKDMYE